MVSSLARIRPLHEICKCAIDGKNCEKTISSLLGKYKPQGNGNNFVKLPFSCNITFLLSRPIIYLKHIPISSCL